MREDARLKSLRQVIRATLSEMSLKGVMKTAISHDMEPWDPETEDPIEATPDAVRKFHSSKKFLSSANWVFQDFPHDIYILPARGAGRRMHGKSSRNFWASPQEALEVLKNYKDVDLQDIKSKLDAGATIVVNGVGVLDKGFLPTAWMILHAMLDDGAGSSPVNSLHGELMGLIASLFDARGEDYNALLSCLTMGSARKASFDPEDDGSEGDLRGVSDVAAEIIVQEVATQVGFHWKVKPITKKFAAAAGLSLGDLQGKLQAISSLVKASGFKQKFISATRSSTGMVIFVSTSSSIYDEENA